MPSISRDVITGLVLADRRSMRMAGVDQGLQMHAGTMQALHAVLSLSSQVAR